MQNNTYELYVKKTSTEVPVINIISLKALVQALGKKKFEKMNFVLRYCSSKLYNENVLLPMPRSSAPVENYR